MGQGLFAVHVAVHAPSTHCASLGHWVPSAHWSTGATHVPERHLDPVGVGQSRSPLHETGALPSAPPSRVVVFETHEATPPLNLQT